MPLEVDDYCFACGSENPAGLRLTWKTDGFQTQTQFIPQKEHQGWKGVVHGGILSACLDEAMTRLAWEKAGEAVTADLSVRFHQPAKVGETLFINGLIDGSKKKMIRGKAEAKKADGTLVASAEARILKV